LTVYKRFRSFVTFLSRSTGIRITKINDKKTSINAKERHETIQKAQKRSGTVIGLNGRGRLGTFESERSNALEQIGNVHASKTKELL
jgi:predicted aspartyl protease